MNPFKKWLDKYGVSVCELAHMLGITARTVQGWLRPDGTPPRSQWEWIEYWTSGGVNKKQLLAHEKKIGKGPPVSNSLNPLRKWLEEKRISQRLFASLLGVSQPAVWRWAQPGRVAPEPRRFDIEQHTRYAVLDRHWKAYEKRIAKGQV